MVRELHRKPRREEWKTTVAIAVGTISNIFVAIPLSFLSMLVIAFDDWMNNLGGFLVAMATFTTSFVSFVVICLMYQTPRAIVLRYVALALNGSMLFIALAVYRLSGSVFVASLLMLMAAVNCICMKYSQLHFLRGQCPKCGYDLRHCTTSGCPECGWRRENSTPSADI